jgi:hypothetical protein
MGVKNELKKDMEESGHDIVLRNYYGIFLKKLRKTTKKP